MQLDKQIQEHVFLLPTELKAEVLDFVLSLEQKREKEIADKKKQFLKLLHSIEPVTAPFPSEEMTAMLRQGQEQLIIDARADYAK
jgi:hypothetical protein